MYLINPVNLSYFEKSLHPHLVHDEHPCLSSELISKVNFRDTYDWGNLLYALTEGRLSKESGRLLADIVNYGVHNKLYVPDYNQFLALYCELSDVDSIEERMSHIIEYSRGMTYTLIKEVYYGDLLFEEISEKYSIPLDRIRVLLENFYHTVQETRYLKYIISNDGNFVDMLIIEDRRIPDEIKNILITNGFITSRQVYDTFKRVRTREGALNKLKDNGINEDKAVVLDTLINIGYIYHLKGVKTSNPPSPISLEIAIED